MARLTDAEREALHRAAGASFEEPPLSPEERYVAPTAEARARYIRFTTRAAAFYRGGKPVRFGGNHWKL